MKNKEEFDLMDLIKLYTILFFIFFDLPLIILLIIGLFI